MRIVASSFAIVAPAALLGGCAAMETGYIDYRRAAPIADIGTSISDYTSSASACAPKTKGKPEACPPLLGARLYRKNLSYKTGIQPDSVYSIRLDYGFFDYVSDPPITLSRIGSGRSPFVSQAEIVVLARAFEFAAIDNKAIDPADPAAQVDPNSFADLTVESLNQAKVIYYSPDVESGQGLNLSNLPILGPVKYGGRPIGIQIIVLELDRVSEEMRGLLSGLASLGQSSGVLPGGASTKILTDLGKSLLEGNQDDVIFEYRFVLDRTNAANSIASAPFEAGRYVLRRMHHRQHEFVWRNLELDHNTGALFRRLTRTDKNGTEVEGYTPYRGETYFTLNIIDHGPTAAEASYTSQTLASLRQAIETQAASRDQTLTEVTSSIRQLTEQYQAATIKQELVEKWDAAENAALRYAYTLNPHTQPTTCKVISVDRGEVSQARIAAMRAAQSFIRDWHDATIAETDSDGNQTVILADDEQERVVDLVAHYFASVPQDPEKHLAQDKLLDFETVFIDAESFAAEFDANSASDFANAVVDYAGLKRPNTCDDLRSLGRVREEET